MEEQELFYDEINKRTWNGAREYLRKLTDMNGYWIFRGQSNPGWRLCTTIERELNFKTPIRSEIESELINEFKRSAHLYIEEKFITNIVFITFVLLFIQ